MKKLNNRGFLLVETLIVATFTLTVLVVLYIQFKNLVVNYNNSYKYNTVEGIYNLNAAKNYVSQYENPSNSLFTQLKASSTRPYLLIYKGSCANNLGLTGIAAGEYCESLMSASNIKTLLYANSDINSLKTYVKTHDDTNISENLKNFIKRIDSESNKHRLIAEYKDGTFATINYGINNGGNGNTFNYTGGVQTFTAPETGYYRVELWGAQGGNDGGAGAYTQGEVKLTAGTSLYIQVGGAGTANAAGMAQHVNGGYNGGGSNEGQNCCSRIFGSGGGATDVRLVGGSWNNANSLNSRIMVAAGGGGSFSDESNKGHGGAGGTLIGLSGTGAYANYCYGAGGKQTSGGEIAIGSTDYCKAGTQVGYTDPGLVTGKFGIGGAHGSVGNYSSGGGGGYYGGSSSGHIASAGGGSSYISGYAGVNSINSAGTHTNTTKHFSGRYFINTTMTAGVNTGQGHALITYIGSVPTHEYSSNLSNVRYIKDCTNGNDRNTANHWVEIQAISEGENVAKSAIVTGTVAVGNQAFVHDGLIDTANYTSVGSGNQCITLTLNKEYNLEEIRIWHYYGDSRYYKANTTSVAGNDNKYQIVRNNREDTETSEGFTINQNS